MGGGEGRGGEGVSVHLWFRCDVTQQPVVRPVEGTGAEFYQNGPLHRETVG